jgi:hypothetical protein
LSVFFHLRSNWRYSPPVNKEQLFDLTERVKLVAGVELSVIVGAQSHKRALVISAPSPWRDGLENALTGSYQ